MDLSDYTEERAWECVSSYVNQDMLVQHQLESYDDFIERKIPQILAGFNPIEVGHGFDETTGLFKYKLKITVQNPELARPKVVEPDGSSQLMTPNIARMRNFSYSGMLYVDILVEAESECANGRVMRDNKILKGVQLGKIPIMVKSKYCILNDRQFLRYDHVNKDECLYDPGGHFIVHGNEKVVISQDRIKENHTLVFYHAKQTHVGFVAEIRSIPDNSFAPPKTTSLALSSKANEFGRSIKVTLHHIRIELPLFVLFRALGVVSDKEIMQHIVYDVNDAALVSLIKELSASADDANHITTQELALDYMSKYMVCSGMMKPYIEVHHRRLLQEILHNDLLPHVGPDLKKKAIYLGYMVQKLLRVALGHMPLDNRDSYINKRIDTPGVLMANLFRQYYTKMVKEMKNLVTKEINSSTWLLKRSLIDIVNNTNIYKFLKATTLESGLKYALATGNWGPKSNPVKQGVAQVLSRMTYFGMLSHLRRLNTPMEKSGKLIPPRKLDNTHFGPVCPVETPEGGSVGLVKNMAMGCRITLAVNSELVYAALRHFGATFIEDPAFELKKMGICCRLLVNGSLIGYTERPFELERQMREKKHANHLPESCHVVWNIQWNVMSFSTEAGRCIKPLLILGREEKNKNKNKHQIFLKPELTFKENVGPAIEFLDVEEVNSKMLAMRPHEVLNNPERRAYGYLEIHPCLMVGVLAANIPFMNHNQAPRNSYQCLHPDEPVLMADGTKRPIRDVRIGDEVITFDLETMATSRTKVIYQYVRPTDKEIRKLSTASGRHLTLTVDHKIMTWKTDGTVGWTEAGKILETGAKPGYLIQPRPVSTACSEERTILSTEQFKSSLTSFKVKESFIEKHASALEALGLLPLLNTHKNLPILARMSGYVLSDGTLNVYEKKHGGMTPQFQITFGTDFDAEMFEDDVAYMGFKSVKTVATEGEMHGRTQHGHAICHNGPFASIFVALGLSQGQHTVCEKKPVPIWIMEGSPMVQREFLGGFQGGDGCKISTASGNDYAVQCGAPYQSIDPKHQKSMQHFMSQIVELMKRFDINVKLTKPKPYTNVVEEPRVRIGYSISNVQKNLITYFDNVGYRYCWHKNTQSAACVEYLRLNQVAVAKRLEFAAEIARSRTAGASIASIAKANNITANMVNSALRTHANQMAHIKPDITVPEFIKTIEFKGLVMFVPLQSAELMPNSLIADITVESENHSFFTGQDHSSSAVKNCAMGKQAIGMFATNFNQRLDTIAHTLHYPERPIVYTKMASLLHQDKLPTGMNAIVAIMTYTGYNQEDSMMINQGAIDRGLFASTATKTYRDQQTKNHSTGEEEEACRPNSSDTQHMKPGSYEKLDPSGFVPKDVYVSGNDIVIGKRMPHKINGQIIYKDTSVCLKATDEGFINQNYSAVNGEGYTMSKMQLRKYRKPTIGDKFSSRYSQKGTCGMTYLQQDMPYTKEGITPDIIMNPHAIPSRMTMAQLLECLLGKTCALEGTFGDGTPFRTPDDKPIERLGDALEALGMERTGNEILYNGRTGEMIQCDIFIGPTYYQRLKHMVDDKIHSRGSNGPVILLTRQPAEGRARSGGLRIGEMERDCLIAHGASTFIKERYQDCSDNYKVYVCSGKKGCGMVAVANPEKNIFTCRNCKGHLNFAEVRIPYAAKLLLQELETMGVVCRMKT